MRFLSPVLTAARQTALALCIVTSAALCVAVLTGPALAQTTVDTGPAVITVLDIIQTAVLTIVGAAFTALAAVLAPVLPTFISAAIVKIAAEKVKEAAMNALGDVFDEIRERAAAGQLTVAIKNEYAARIATYLVGQVSLWVRLARMDKDSVTAFVAKLIGNVFGGSAITTAAVAGVSAPAAAAPEPSVAVNELLDVVKGAVREVAADPASALTIAPVGGIGLGR